jgi:Zn finger protein HypA/HybF involved in hydrogenase expression
MSDESKKFWLLGELKAEKERARKHELDVIAARVDAAKALAQDAKQKKVDLMTAETGTRMRVEKEKLKRTAKSAAEAKESAKIAAKKAGRDAEQANIRQQLETLRQASGSKKAVTPSGGVSEWQPQLTAGPPSGTNQFMQQMMMMQQMWAQQSRRPPAAGPCRPRKKFRDSSPSENVEDEEDGDCDKDDEDDDEEYDDDDEDGVVINDDGSLDD